MKPKLLIVAAIASALLAIPISGALSKQSNQLKIERTKNRQYQLRIDRFKNQTQVQQELIEAKESEKKQLEQQKADLEKQLQSKREAQARLAVAAVAAPVVQSVGAGNCSAYTGLLAQYNWDQRVALAVMRAESGCNPVAASPSCDSGLMQINCVHIAKVNGNLAALKDPATNIQVAYQIYAAQGWNPWVAYTSGAYRKFL